MIDTDVVDGSVHLTVENAGPRVQSYDLPALLEPFRRLPKTERIADSAGTSIGRGAGLGCRSCGRSPARTPATSRPPREDGGLRVLVRLPAAPGREGG